MKKFNLQLFAEAVQGKRIVYLFRVLSKAAEKAATAMAFVTENERTKTKDAESTATKDGSIRTPGVAEIELSATAILAKGDPMAEELEDAMDADELMEVWEVNLDEPGSTDGKFKSRYFQGYMTEFTLTSSAEEHAEYSTAFGLNGNGVKGEATVTDEQQDIANYVFKDTTATGA